MIFALEITYTLSINEQKEKIIVRRVAKIFPMNNWQYIFKKISKKKNTCVFLMISDKRYKDFLHPLFAKWLKSLILIIYLYTD